MNKIFSVMLLCAALMLASCSTNEDTISVSGVTLNETTLTLTAGDAATLVATIAPDDADEQGITWASSNEAVATVSPSGEVTAVKAGTATITAASLADNTKKATCAVTVMVIWSTGNLIADGANGAKIGTATDGGLYFQFGSLIGWSETGDPTIAVSPVGYTGSTSWSSSWIGDPATENVATGTGDPCKYYLKDTWRLATRDEYEKLIENNGYPSTGPWTWDGVAKTATNRTSSLTFPTSGYRLKTDGLRYYVEEEGYSWSASPTNTSGYCLAFGSSFLSSSISHPWANGLPVRCVKEN